MKRFTLISLITLLMACGDDSETMDASASGDSSGDLPSEDSDHPKESDTVDSSVGTQDAGEGDEAVVVSVSVSGGEGAESDTMEDSSSSSGDGDTWSLVSLSESASSTAATSVSTSADATGDANESGDESSTSSSETTSSSESSSSESTGSVDEGPLGCDSPWDDSCQACSAKECCDLLVDCLDVPKCACWFDCMSGVQDENECMLLCGGSDEKSALQNCHNDVCNQECVHE